MQRDTSHDTDSSVGHRHDAAGRIADHKPPTQTAFMGKPIEIMQHTDTLHWVPPRRPDASFDGRALSASGNGFSSHVTSSEMIRSPVQTEPPRVGYQPDTARNSAASTSYAPGSMRSSEDPALPPLPSNPQQRRAPSSDQSMRTLGSGSVTEVMGGASGMASSTGPSRRSSFTARSSLDHARASLDASTPGPRFSTDTLPSPPQGALSAEPARPSMDSVCSGGTTASGSGRSSFAAERVSFEAVRKSLDAFTFGSDSKQSQAQAVDQPSSKAGGVSPESLARELGFTGDMQDRCAGGVN